MRPLIHQNPPGTGGISRCDLLPAPETGSFVSSFGLFFAPPVRCTRRQSARRDRLTMASGSFLRRASPATLKFLIPPERHADEAGVGLETPSASSVSLHNTRTSPDAFCATNRALGQPMKEPSSADQDPLERASSRHRHHAPPPIVLWRMRGATDDLRALLFETSFGVRARARSRARPPSTAAEPGVARYLRQTRRVDSDQSGVAGHSRIHPGILRKEQYR